MARMAVMPVSKSAILFFKRISEAEEILPLPSKVAAPAPKFENRTVPVA